MPRLPSPTSPLTAFPMNSSTAGKAAAGLLFTGLAAYSAYTWRRLSARASSSSGPAPPPLLSRAAYLALLQEVSPRSCARSPRMRLSASTRMRCSDGIASYLASTPDTIV